MYAVYNYKSGSSQLNVLNDIVAILTGTTNVASLSASCNQVNTSITATVASAWSLYDSAAGTNLQVIRALNNDGSTYKYGRCNLTSATSFGIEPYESWNSTAHTGTNGAGVSNPVTMDLTNGGYLYIYATGRNIVIIGWTSGAAYTGPFRLCEYSRDLVVSGYPCFTTDGNCPRVKKPDATGDSYGPSVWLACLTTSVTDQYSAVAEGGFYRDASENIYYNLWDVGAAYSPGSGSTKTYQGKCYDIKITSTYSNISPLDTFVYGGKTYVAMRATGSSRLIWVPQE